MPQRVKINTTESGSARHQENIAVSSSNHIYGFVEDCGISFVNAQSCTKPSIYLMHVT